MIINQPIGWLHLHSFSNLFESLSKNCTDSNADDLSLIQTQQENPKYSLVQNVYQNNPVNNNHEFIFSSEDNLTNLSSSLDAVNNLENQIKFTKSQKIKVLF